MTWIKYFFEIWFSRIYFSKLLFQGKNHMSLVRTRMLIARNSKSLTISAQVNAILATPCSTTWSTDGLSVAISFAETARALASRGESTKFTMLVNWIADPVDLWITTNRIVEDVDADDLVVFVCGVLCDPVGVQHTESTHTTANTFLKWMKTREDLVWNRQQLARLITYLSNRLQVSVWLQLVDTMALGLAIGATLVNWTFASTTTNTDAVDEESLLCTISETTCFVGTRWTWRSMESGELTILPASNAEQVSHDIALLLAIKFLNVAISSHLVLR